MNKFLMLALRNVFRNRRRTLMTVFMVGGGVAGLVLVGGFFAFMYHGLREGVINNGLGHIQIFTAEHFTRDEEHVLDTGINNWKQIEAAIEKVDHIRGVAPRIDFYGMVSNGEKTALYMGSAVDPDAEMRLGFRTNIISGHNLSSSSSGGTEALIGSGLAKTLHVKVGDGLSLLATTADGALNGIDIEIVGIVNTGIKEYDDRYLRIALPAAQLLLQSDRVTNLVVGLDKTENTDRVAADLAPRLTGLPQEMVIRRWIDLATSYRQIRSLFNTIYIFIGIIVFFMVLMASVNTLLMAMFERTREIGTMLAMGTPREWIVSLFVVEGTILGTVGALAGVLAGNLIGVLINSLHIYLPPPPGSTDNLPFTVLYVPSLMILSSLLVIASLTTASMLPAIRASRLQISEALAHV